MTCTCAYHDQLIEIRRHLHTMPEEGWSEFTTTAFIVGKLREYGYEVLLGKKVINPDNCLGRNLKVVEAGLKLARENGVSEELLAEMDGLTGCVGVMDTGRPGPTLAIRFDIDCVPVTESTEDCHIPAREGFISKRPGLMHACGHDAHTSTGLAVAHWFADNVDQMNGKIKILFQPAEEGVRGAAGMAASGILDDADYFLGAHIAMMCKSGEVSVNPYGFLLHGPSGSRRRRTQRRPQRHGRRLQRLRAVARHRPPRQRHDPHQRGPARCRRRPQRDPVARRHEDGSPR